MSRVMRKVLLLMAVLSLLLTGCDHLDDGDGGQINDVLLGEWAFSYSIRSDEDPGFEFDYKTVVFNADKTCSLLFVDGYELQLDDEGQPLVDVAGDEILVPRMGELHGTYVASATMIRIVSYDIGNEERVMLWRVVSLSPRQVVAEYDFTLDGVSMTAVVTLDKQ